jgi:hypothetical protein
MSQPINGGDIKFHKKKLRTIQVTFLPSLVFGLMCTEKSLQMTDTKLLQYLTFPYETGKLKSQLEIL